MLLFLLSFAWADITDDLKQASNKNLAQNVREEAFSRLVVQGSKDSSLLKSIANNQKEELQTRWIAIRVLGRVGGRMMIDELSPLLIDPKPDIRIAACSALGDIRSWVATKSLRERLQDDVLTVRVAAAQALGKLADPSAVEDLSEALYAESHFYRGKGLWVRVHFVEAMGKLRDKRAYPTLLKALDDEDPKVQRSAVWALEQTAGLSLGEGRNSQEEKEAWKRWLALQLTK